MLTKLSNMFLATIQNNQVNSCVLSTLWSGERSSKAYQRFALLLKQLELLNGMARGETWLSTSVQPWQLLLYPFNDTKLAYEFLPLHNNIIATLNLINESLTDQHCRPLHITTVTHLPLNKLLKN